MVSSKSLSIAVMFLLYGKTAALELPEVNNLAKVQDNSFLDTKWGEKMSQLSLHMLNKQKPDHPINNEMLMTEAKIPVPIDVKLL